MNLKELQTDLGENPKITNLLIAILEMSTRNQAILDTMTKDHNEICASIRGTTREEQYKEFKEKSEKTYAEIKAGIVSFII